jgi:hypothetical protein
MAGCVTLADRMRALVRRSAALLACIATIVSLASGCSCCGDAGSLVEYSEELQEDIAEAIPFGSRWEVEIRSHYYEAPSLTYWAPPWIAALLVASGASVGSIPRAWWSTEYEGEREADAEMVLTFEIPPWQGEPISCDDAEAIYDYYGGDTAEAREAVLALVYLDFMDWAGGQGIEAAGPATHQAEVAKSFTTEPVVPGPCVEPNPCANNRAEWAGCAGVGTQLTLSTDVWIEWLQGEQAQLYIGDSYNLTGNDPGCTQQHDYNNIEWEAVENPTGLCDVQQPVCDERVHEDVECWCSFPGYDVDNSVPLATGTYTLHEYSDEDGDERWTRVTLRCVSGCECSDDSECDDGRECTRDECVSGNCENTPDDAIIPTQVPDDCRRCENGEVASVREEFERTCDQYRADAVDLCSQYDEEWLVYWSKSIGGHTENLNYCAAGEENAVLGVCDGSAECSQGELGQGLVWEYTHDCLSYAGQEISMRCDVVCNFCIVPP